MKPIKSVSFTTPYSAEEQAIERRRELARALQARGQEGLGATEMIGGWAIPKSPLEGLGKVAQSLSGAYQERQATDMAKALQERMQGDRTADMGALAAALRGQPASPGVDDPAAGQYAPPTAAQGPNPQAMQGMEFRSPMFQEMQAKYLMEQMKPKNPNDMLSKINPRDYTPESFQAFMQSQNPALLRPVAEYTTVGNNLVQKPQGAIPQGGIQPVYTAPETKPNDVREYEYAKAQGYAGSFQQFQQQQRKAGAANVSVKTAVQTGAGLAKEIGPMVAESKAGALGALDAINTAGRIKAALSSGNVTLGPTATVRNQIDQVAQVMGVAGKTTEEKLVNTREVTRGLAQFTIAARKALKGQGQVSDFEGKLLTKAESGAIDDFTMPELKAFIATTDRLARRQYGLHKSNVDVMRKRPDLEKLVPFYEVPDLPAADSGSGGWSIKPVN